MAVKRPPLTPGSDGDPLDDVRVRLERIESALEKLKRTDQLVQALARRLYLDGVDLPPRKQLRSHRVGVMSQNGEDGLLLELFRRIGVERRRFVEIGCGVNGGNSGFLAQELGWSGLMVDGNPGAVSKVELKFASEDIKAECHLVSPETINEIIETAGLAGEIDLLSIDIDGNDFWVWDATTVTNPRVVIIEYNYLLGRTAAVTIPYKPEFRLKEAPTRAYRGASLEAMVRLGRRKGYRLVSSERINAVFLRDDIDSDLPTLETREAYQPPANRGREVYKKIGDHGLTLVPVNEDGTPAEPVPAEQAR